LYLPLPNKKPERYMGGAKREQNGLGCWKLKESGLPGNAT